LNRKRSVYSGTSLLENLKFHEVSDNAETFQMIPADFELLINFIGQKIVQWDTRFRAAITVQERQAVTV